MGKLKSFFDNGLPHWYYQSWFICLLFCFWFLVIPLFPAIILLIFQHNELKRMYVNKHNVAVMDQYRDGVIKWAENYKLLLSDYKHALDEKQNTLTETAKKEALQNLKSEYHAYAAECEKVKRAAEGYQAQLIANADQYCQEKMDAAESVYQSVLSECNEIKSTAINYNNRVISEADEYYAQKTSDADALYQATQKTCNALTEESNKTVADMKSSIVKYQEQWKAVHILTDKQYLQIKKKADVTLSVIDKISNGHDFEYLLADMLRDIGYCNVEVTKGSGDMGADILAEKDEIRYAIQCKRYKNQVDTAAVQQILSGLQYYHCHIGVVVTNSTFTIGARDLARETQVVLWDRSYLQKIAFEQARQEYIHDFGNEYLKWGEENLS